MSATDLRGANLRGANLRATDLREANLSEADLRWANLRGADLSGADLSGADLDFASWPLHCGSFGAKADDRLAAQLLAHCCRLNVSGCSGGVREAIEHIRKMGLAELFYEYRRDAANGR